MFRQGSIAVLLLGPKTALSEPSATIMFTELCTYFTNTANKVKWEENSTDQTPLPGKKHWSPSFTWLECFIHAQWKY